MRPTWVYGLYEGFSNTPFYIGISIEPKKRLWAHRAAAAGTRRDTLTGCGVKPGDITMRLLAECDNRANAELIETALQTHYEIK